MKRAFLLPLAASLLSACHQGNPTELGPHVPTALTETQAHLVIERRLLDDARVLAKEQGATLDEVGTTRLDFVFGRPARGVEWLSEDERTGAQWPAPAADGSPLRVLRGTLDDGSPVHVLLLDERDYLYEGNPRWVQRGAAPGIDGIEDRLAQDVDEFLEFVAAEDAPLSAP